MPNGVQAVTAVEVRSYDLLLMVMQMPKLDGRAEDATVAPAAAVPTIALAGDALVGPRESRSAAGMNDYLSNPLKPEQLHAAIDRLAGAKKAVA